MKKFWQDNSTPFLCIKLGVIAVAMFAFALFVMPPLYNLFCEVTGLNGKTGGPYSVVDELSADTSRNVKIQFLATNNENMPWEFRPMVNEVTVHPGESKITKYFARNTADRNMVAQAIPSVTPSEASRYLHKTECFCFNQQALDSGDSAELGLSFFIDKNLPKHINTITLSYTLFDVTEKNRDQKDASKATSTIFKNEQLVLVD